MDLPEKYYWGMEFVEDKETVEVVIDFSLYSPALLEPFEIFVSGKKITGIQQTNLLHITFEQIISKKLLDTLKGKGHKDEFIIGYISRYLPSINQEILRQRYSLGHFLVQTYSIFNILMPSVTPKGTEQAILITWAPTLTSFPPLKEFEGKYDEIHIRDFIDAGNSYITGDYDACIRKVITSAENAFRFHGLKGTFVGIIQKYIYLDKNLGRQVVTENLKFVYKLRNKIVHDKFRINFENGWVCKKAIGTLNYLLQILGVRDGSVRYIHLLSMQFIMSDEYLKGTDLDALKAREEYVEKFKEKIPIIDSPKKMDEFMFEGLRISDEEKDAVLSNKVATKP